MKTGMMLLLAFLMMGGLSACGSNVAKTERATATAGSTGPQVKPNESGQNQAATKPHKVLVAYYSWGGNTREIAQQIQKSMGGDIFEIQPAKPYPTDYDAVVKQAKEEISADYRPVLKEKVGNIDQYDVVFVGTPNWWSTIAPPVATFLSENNLAGKTVVPFVTHGGGGQAKCFGDIAKLCPQSTLLDGFVISGRNAKDGQNEVNKWLSRINLK